MKTKLEAIANVAVIVVALAAGYAVLGRYAAAIRAPRAVSTGDHLAAIRGVDWTQHRHTLVLALNTGCHYCEQSVPFYQQLASTQHLAGEDLAIVAVFPNQREKVRHFMMHENLAMQSVAEVPLERIRVDVTPTLILIDRTGRVEWSWIGVLTPSEELDLLRAVTVSPSCSVSGLSAVQAGEQEGCDSSAMGQSKTKNGGGK